MRNTAQDEIQRYISENLRNDQVRHVGPATRPSTGHPTGRTTGRSPISEVIRNQEYYTQAELNKLLYIPNGPLAWDWNAVLRFLQKPIPPVISDMTNNNRREIDRS